MANSARPGPLLEVQAGGWRIRLESVSEMRADAATFRVWTSLRAFENEECLFARTWAFDIPRDGA